MFSLYRLLGLKLSSLRRVASAPLFLWRLQRLISGTCLAVLLLSSTKDAKDAPATTFLGLLFLPLVLLIRFITLVLLL